MNAAGKASVASVSEAIDTIMNFQHVTFQKKLKKPTIGPSEDSYQPKNKTHTSFIADFSVQMFVVSFYITSLLLILLQQRLESVMM